VVIEKLPLILPYYVHKLPHLKNKDPGDARVF